MPSSSARPVAPPGAFRVEREDLLFQCDERSEGDEAGLSRKCRVTASYVVDAPADVQLSLRFAVPVATVVSGKVGEQSPRFAFSRASDDRASLHYDVRHDTFRGQGAALPPLYEAETSLALRRGRNTLSFSYEQELTLRETGHSYFSAGFMEPELTYLLWPLREWTLARDFRIFLQIDLARPRPSWWKRVFGHPVGTSCNTRGRSRQEGDRLVFRAELASDFPDALVCVVGGRNVPADVEDREPIYTPPRGAARNHEGGR